MKINSSCLCLILGCCALSHLAFLFLFFFLLALCACGAAYKFNSVLGWWSMPLSDVVTPSVSPLPLLSSFPLHTLHSMQTYILRSHTHIITNAHIQSQTHTHTHIHTQSLSLSRSHSRSVSHLSLPFSPSVIRFVSRLVCSRSV